MRDTMFVIRLFAPAILWGPFQVLKAESSILKKLQGSPYVCRFYHFARVSPSQSVLVMELLGPNLRSFSPDPCGLLNLFPRFHAGLTV